MDTNNHTKLICNALLALYNCQTEDEKKDKSTTRKNHVGFNKFDGPILSSLADYLLKYGYLSNKQIALAEKKLVKYNKQIEALCGQRIFA